MPKDSEAEEYDNTEPPSNIKRGFHHQSPSASLPEYTAAYLRSLTLEELYHARNGAKRRSVAVSYISRRGRSDLKKIDREIKRRRPGPIISVPTGRPPPPNAPPKDNSD